jgi:hypothetical protein
MGRFLDLRICPADIALLLAVPLSNSDFVTAVGGSDWLSKYHDPDLSTKARSNALEGYWSDEYLPLVAEPLQKLRDLAISLSVDVRTGVHLSDLQECSVSKSVLILFAHWKGPEVLTEDLVAPINLSEFLGRAQKSETALAQWLRVKLRDGIQPKRGSLSSLIWGKLKRRSRSSVRDVLANALTVVLPEDVPTNGIQKVLEYPITCMTRRRDEIDSLFLGLVKPGNRLELFDGLHTKEEVECSIAGPFEGILPAKRLRRLQKNSPVSTETIVGIDFLFEESRNGQSETNTGERKSLPAQGWGSRLSEGSWRTAKISDETLYRCRVLVDCIPCSDSLYFVLPDEKSRPDNACQGRGRIYWRRNRRYDRTSQTHLERMESHEFAANSFRGCVGGTAHGDNGQAY